MPVMSRPPGSAAQPANDMTAAEYMTGDSLPPPGIDAITSGQLRCYGEFYRLAFYNIGWNKDSKKKHHTMENLAREVCDMVRDRRADGVGICEVYNLRDEHDEQRQRIMDHLLSELNSSAGQPASSAESSAAQPAWRGQWDGHYIFVWNSHRLALIDYEYISCGVEENAWRMAQYLQFRRAESQSGAPLHICHVHSPSSKRGNLTDGRRKTVFKTLWAHVMRKAHNDSNDSAVQPVTVFAGDFNSTALEWNIVFRDAEETQASRRTVQTCTSAVIPSHHGDRAMVFNAMAAQEDSRWGKRFPRAGKEKPFSDDHDVVLVPVCWNDGVPLASSSAAQPACESVHLAAKSQLLSADMYSHWRRDVISYASKPTQLQRTRRWAANSAHVPTEVGSQVCSEADPSSSAAQPASPPDASMTTHAESKSSDAVARLEVVTEAHASSSAAQPASPSERPKPISPGDADTLLEDPEEEILSHPGDPHFGKVVAAPSMIIPSQQTPLYNDFLEKLTATDDQGTLEALADICIFDKLKCKQPHGSAPQPADKMDDPYELGLRMEHLLSVTNRQRALQIERLSSRGDQRANSPETLIFNSDDMREVMNTWRNQPETWSNAVEALKNLPRNQDVHLKTKNKFNAMVFEIFGNRALVDVFIRYPVCSAAQPAQMLKRFAEGWQTWRSSEEAKTRQECSQKKEPGHVRLSIQINKLKHKESRGKSLADWIQEDPSNWYKLGKREKGLWKDFTEGKISDEIRELRQQQQPRSGGAAEQIHAAAQIESNAAQLGGINIP